MENSVIETLYRPKRYASIDFLRGMAILTMLVLHTVMDTFEVDKYVNELSNISSINLLALIIMPYLGGLAGLFLMTSATGNMIGMRKNLEKGQSPDSVIRKQVVGGALIIIFAHFGEAFLGYHGGFGQITKNLNNIPGILSGEVVIHQWKSQAYHFETLHTIGWCVLVNGAIQGMIAKRFDLSTDSSTVIRIYFLMAGVVLLTTPIVWAAVEALIPGYPWGVNGDEAMWRVIIGESPPQDYIIYLLINPLAAEVEPIFPYLATSFMGSIIGIYMSNPKESDFDKSFVKRFFWIGTLCFFVGFIGVGIVLGDLGDFDAAIDKYRTIYNHRAWVPEKGLTALGGSGWFWQFMTLNGMTVMITMTVIRISEYRGKGEQFAKATQFVRRFGFIAFTIYITQWVYYVIQFLVSSVYPDYTFFGEIITVDAYSRMPWPGVWAIVILTILTFHFVMKAWEKKGYLGSFEWMIITLAGLFSPVKKQVANPDANQDKWWQTGMLNVDGIFYDPEWQNFPVIDKIQEERRLIRNYSIAGFFVAPFSFIAFLVARDFEKENPSEDIKFLKNISIAGIAFFIIWFLALNILSLSDFGIEL